MTYDTETPEDLSSILARLEAASEVLRPSLGRITNDEARNALAETLVAVDDAVAEGRAFIADYSRRVAEIEASLPPVTG
jgi:hypothetical protein